MIFRWHLLLLAFVSCVVLTGACQAGWTTHGNRCLKELPGTATFQAAQQACLAAATAPVAARLVVFNDDTDMDSIITALSLSTANTFWVDGSVPLSGSLPRDGVSHAFVEMFGLCRSANQVEYRSRYDADVG